MARPTIYTPELAREICRRLAGGESLRSICRADDMPDERTVRGWAEDDYQGFAAPYAKARDLGMESMADELLAIADDGSNDWMERQRGDETVVVANGEAVARSRLRVDTRKWLMSKIAPKKYGDRLTTEHVGPNNGPIEISDKEAARQIAFMLAKGVDRE